MNILITNDDGYQAPGINALFNALKKRHKVKVIAPFSEKSGCSLSFSLNKEMKLVKIEEQKYSLEGTPVDCVKTGIMRDMRDNIELILSGINDGPNLGTDINYSGTVAAARHAFYQGYPAISVSRNFSDFPENNNYTEKDFDKEAEVIADMIDKINPEPGRFLYNINFPYHFENISGIKPTFAGRRKYKDYIKEKQINEASSMIYFYSDPPEDIYSQGSDADAVKNNYISITPLSHLYENFSTFNDHSGLHDNSHSLKKKMEEFFENDENLKKLILNTNSLLKGEAVE